MKPPEDAAIPNLTLEEQGLLVPRSRMPRLTVGFFLGLLAAAFIAAMQR